MTTEVTGDKLQDDSWRKKESLTKLAKCMQRTESDGPSYAYALSNNSVLTWTVLSNNSLLWLP